MITFDARTLDELHISWIPAMEAAGFRFDEERAERPIRWIEQHFVFTSHADRLKVGTPIRLPAFWKTHIRHLFGWVDPQGRRVVRLAYWQTPKKQAKSTIAALVALYLLFADSEPDGNVVLGGRDKTQAGILFDEAVKQLNASPTFSRLIKSKVVSVGTSYNNKLIKYALGTNSGKLWVTSSDAGTAAGHNLSAIVFDEASTQDSTALFDILTQGSGLQRSQQLCLLLSNAGIIGESPLQEKFLAMAQTWHTTPPAERDWSFYPVIYGLAPDEDAWRREENWIRANPAISDPEIPFMDVAAVRAEYRKALMGTDRDRSEFRRLMCGQQVSSEETWIDSHLWEQAGAAIDWNEFRGLPCWAGLDVSSKQDFTALTLAWMRDGLLYLKFRFWYPSADLARKADRLGQPLEAWAARGYISLTEGECIEEAMFERHIREMHGQLKLQVCGYDQAYAIGLAQRLVDAGVNMVPVPQGAQRMNEPILHIEDMVRRGLVRHDGNPVMSWMMRCAGIKTDGEGRKKIVKPDRKKHVRRVDGPVSMLMAVDQVIRAENAVSIYEKQLPVVFSGVQ